MTMKISTPRPPSAPAATPTGARPQQDNAALQEDAELFRQSLDGKQPAAEKQPEARGAGTEHGAARYQSAPVGTRPRQRHERAGAGAHQHGAAEPHRHGVAETPERATAGTPQYGIAGTPPRARERAGTQPGADGADTGTCKPGAQSTQSHQSGPDSVAQRQPKPAFETDQADATESDAAASPVQTDAKDPVATTEPGQDLYRLLATQEARAHEIATQKAAQVATPTIAPELINKVAERILVTVNNIDQNKEVRILVKDTVLQNTEVALKHEEGRLVVNFMTQSAADNALLSNNSQTLKESLQQALGGEVRVGINADTGGDADPQRHSRGLYLDDEHDDG